MFHTNEPRFEFFNIGSINRFQKEAYITLGQAIDISSSITLHPALMINFTLNQTSINFNNQGYIDLSLLGRFQDRFLAGVRLQDEPSSLQTGIYGWCKTRR